MTRRKPKHDDLVREIRECVANANLVAAVRWDDDMDQYYTAKTGSSPMLTSLDRYAAHMRAARERAARLLDLGPEAADAVAKGLRTQGYWRELLLPYAEKHVDLSCIRDTLELVARREIDPLTSTAAAVLHRDEPPPSS
jgi:hypothetical protein